MGALRLGRLILGTSVFAMACNGGAADGDGSGGGSSNQTADDTSSETDTAMTPTGDASQGSAEGTMSSADATEGPTDTATDPTVGTATDPTMGTATDPTVGTTVDPDTGPQMGCGGIDFLFVIDNSGSMAAQQATLLASFPGFISSIQTSLMGLTDNYHVGVITTDDYAFNEAGCQSLGDLVTQTGGANALGQVCTPFAEGSRFATEQDDLGTALPCIAQVGTGGAFVELPVTGAIAAIDPANNGPGACNDGFIREEAILVLVILTDDPPFAPDMDDANLLADTSGWYDAIIAAKNDDPEAVVTIGFVPWDDTSCVFMGLESPNLIDFVGAFGDQGVLASICEPDYGPTFDEAINTIVTSCENFEM